jgi:SulP family sulfate permease
MTAARWTPKLFSVLKDGYGGAELRADALAGLTVAIVALPLSMALGIASGASPDKGLVTAIVAGFFISLLGGSRVQIGGPTGAFVVIVFNVIAQHGYDGMVLATAMAGVILMIAGYARAGQLVKYVPAPVVTGFTAGIALIIATSQIKDFFGLTMANVPADFIPKWQAYAHDAATVNWSAAAVGAGALALIIVLRRSAPRAPGFLIAIVAAAAVVALLKLPVDTIGSRFPNMQSGLPLPHIPALSLAKAQEVLPAAFTIAFLAGIESLLSAVVADGMTGFRHRSNQELVGQGVGNLASALFGGMPATGAIARTATNVRSGGRSPVAGMLHAVFLLLFVLFAGDLMAFVPMAALAAILFIVAWGMSEIDRVRMLLRMPKADRVVLVLTFLLTVLVDLTVAIGVGVTLASLMFMARMSETVAINAGATMVPEEGDEPGSGNAGGQRDTLPPGVEVFQITGPFFFGVAGELLDTLRRLGQPPRVIILRLRLVPFLDASGAAAVEAFVEQAHKLGSKVILSGLQPGPRSVLAHAGLGRAGGRVVFARDYGEALDKARGLAAA